MHGKRQSLSPDKITPAQTTITRTLLKSYKRRFFNSILPQRRRTKFSRAWWIMKSETLGDARIAGEKTLAALPSHVEILSAAEAIDFPGQWYDIMAGNHFWMVWRTRAFLRQGRALSIFDGNAARRSRDRLGYSILRRMLEAATRWTIDARDLNAAALAHNAPGRGRTAISKLTLGSRRTQIRAKIAIGSLKLYAYHGPREQWWQWR